MVEVNVRVMVMVRVKVKVKVKVKDKVRIMVRVRVRNKVRVKDKVRVKVKVNNMSSYSLSLKLPPGVLEEGVFRLDWSGFSDILRCWRYGWHKLAWRRVSGARDEAQGFGKAIHAALDVRQRELMEAPGKPVDVTAMEAALEPYFAGVELPEDEYRTLGRAKEVVGLYVKEHPNEDFDILASERSGEKELGCVSWRHKPRSLSETHTVKVLWNGRTDGIWRDRRNGRPVIKDTKTTKEAQIEQVHNKFKMSGQLKGYCWLFSGGDFGQIHDAVVDLVIVRKSLVKPRTNSAPRTEFHRLPFTYSDVVIEEWRRDVLATVGAWLTACGRHSQPPPMTGAPEECHRYNKPCQFLSVCEQASEVDRMRWLLSGNFVDNEWDVMKETK